MAHPPFDVPSPAVSPPADELLHREARAQLALNDLFPHLRAASDAALRDLVISLRVPVVSPSARA
jgi:hypothetical protein